MPVWEVHEKLQAIGAFAIPLILTFASSYYFASVLRRKLQRLPVLLRWSVLVLVVSALFIFLALFLMNIGAYLIYVAL